MSRPIDCAKQQLWLRHFRRWQSSCLTVRAYCERQQLSEASFYCWKRLLQQRGLLSDGRPHVQAVADEPLFLPVAVQQADAPTRHIDLVLLDGLTVRIGAGFDAQTLRQVLALLREQP